MTFRQLKDMDTCQQHDPDVKHPHQTNGYIGDCKICGAAVLRYSWTVELPPSAVIE